MAVKISLVIPIKNERNSLGQLIESIKQQTLQPDEIIIVDGGSTDDSVALVEKIALQNSKLKLIKTPRAYPGEGRNIGAADARNKWIAFTDAGIKLKNDWLEKLAEPLSKNSDVDIVYGNYTPLNNRFFDKISILTYVPPQKQNVIRSKSIVSYLMKDSVFKTVGGFPELRAAEDLIFMEKAEQKGFNIAYAPEAMACWELRPDWLSTFQKFVLYSKYNVWAGRKKYWHHGVLKNYLYLVPVIILAVFHSWFWLFGIVGWLGARTTKRILSHSYEFGMTPLFNPLIFLGVAILILTIDLATFVGWFQASVTKNQQLSN